MSKRNHFWSLACSQDAGRVAHSEARARRRGLSSGLLHGLWHEEEGQTLVEYGLLIGLLALVAVAAVTLFGRRMSNNLYGTSNSVLPFGT